MSDSQVTVCLLTYNRLEYAERTLKTTLSNLRYSGPIAVHIGDDGSGWPYREYLVSVARKFKVAEVTCSDSQRGGYGMNYNLSMQSVHVNADYVLVLEDDWELVRELNLDPIVGALQTQAFGCVRMGYVGYTQPLRGQFIASAGMQWLLLDPNSPEPHVFAGHPRLETKEWERSVGPWPEGLQPGQTEFAVTHIPAARKGVVWPVDIVRSSGDLFVHIGTIRSY